MKTHVKALVVGGGAVGTGIAYHLAKYGWNDIMLLERDELTSGSTWHAAGLLPLFNMGYATSHLHDYSVDFYKSLEAETGLNAGFSVVGNLRMAQTKDRMDEYMLYGSTAETLGIEYEKLTPNQIKERWPLIRTDDLEGAIYHPTDGYINPADVTMAMAKGARQMGVSIERKWQVDGYKWTGEEWKVTCTKMVEKGGNLIPSEEQIVISGKIDDLDKLILTLKENSIKNIKLPVSAPFHCSLMNKATSIMSEELNKLSFNQVNIKLISNVTAKEISSTNELKDLLIRQIENRVRWRESVINMINNNVNHFIEIGPGKILSGLVKRINREVKINTINNQEDI